MLATSNGLETSRSTTFSPSAMNTPACRVRLRWLNSRYGARRGSSIELTGICGMAELNVGQDRHDARLQRSAGDVDFARRTNQHVDLAPHTELVEIDARLNRKARPRQYEPVFPRF